MQSHCTTLSVDTWGCLDRSNWRSFLQPSLPPNPPKVREKAPAPRLDTDDAFALLVPAGPASNKGTGQTLLSPDLTPDGGLAMVLLLPAGRCPTAAADGD